MLDGVVRHIRQCMHGADGQRQSQVRVKAVNMVAHQLSRKGRFTMFNRKEKPTTEGGQYIGSYKYSAAKLKEKGVLVKVDGVGDGQ